jgi:type II secretory pathway component PulF
MPAFLVGLLATAKAPESQSQVFEFLASYYDSRHRRRRAILEGAIIPVMSLVMGVVVASVGIMLFTPIIQIMDKLAGLYGK